MTSRDKSKDIDSEMAVLKFSQRMIEKVIENVREEHRDSMKDIRKENKESRDEIVKDNKDFNKELKELIKEQSKNYVTKAEHKALDTRIDSIQWDIDFGKKKFWWGVSFILMVVWWAILKWNWII